MVLSIALGASAAFMSFRAWRRTTGGVAERLTCVERQEVADAVRVAWKRYWKNAAFIAVLYGLNLVMSLVFKGAYRFARGTCLCCGLSLTRCCSARGSSCYASV